MTPRRLIVLIALVAAVVGVQPASAVNSPNMRVNYTLLDQTSGRTHSDIAFWGNIGVAGNYDGFRVFNTKTQALITYFPCRGSQGDVSLWNANGRLLLFLSNDTPQTNGATVCSTVRSSDTSACGPPCFEGIRIFDLSDPANPVRIASVYTDCGSHTHTLVPDLANNRVLLYISSYPGGSGPNCQSPFRKISIVQVPLNAPETASVLSQKPLTTQVPGCHDITVFMAIHKAAASCATEGQIWDITDPANPDTLNPVHVDDPGVNYWHSAEFTWDGQYVVWDDESFTGTCQPAGDGKIRIYRVSDAALMSSFMIPRAQTRLLLGAQRQRHPRPGAISPGLRLVYGRHVGDRLHEPDEPAGDRVRRPVGRRGLVVLLVQRPHLRERHVARAGRREHRHAVCPVRPSRFRT